MTPPATTTAFVELHVPDFGKAKTYYQSLGFQIVWERKSEEFKGYLVMQLEENFLCFWAGNENVYKHSYFKKFSKDTKRGYGVEIVFMIKDIEAYYNNVKDIAHVVEPLVMKPWGNKDFRCEDPFGYYLRFTEFYNTLYDDVAVP